MPNRVIFFASNQSQYLVCNPRHLEILSLKLVSLMMLNQKASLTKDK